MSLAGNNARGCSCKVSPTYVWGIFVVVAAAVIAVVKGKVYKREKLGI